MLTLLQETHTVHRDRKYVRTQLIKIANKSRQNKSEKFTSIYHLLNKEMLKQCVEELKTNKASGIAKVTKQEYKINLDKNITILVEKLINGTYKPQPSKRIYIPI